MEEKFGFLSRFPPAKMNMKKKSPFGLIPRKGVPTNNPPSVVMPANIRKSLLTDDESDNSDEKINNEKAVVAIAPPAEAVVNRILVSDLISNRSLIERDPDETYCSVLEKDKDSKSLFGTDEYKAANQSKAVDDKAVVRSSSTVVGDFLTDEEDDNLCEQLSEMRVSRQGQRRKSQLQETQVGPFTDEIEESKPQVGLCRQMADTIIHETSDEDETEDENQNRQQAAIKKLPQMKPRVSLPSTVVGPFTSELMSGHCGSLADLNNITEGSRETDESAITILDSEDEYDVSHIKAHPPVYGSASDSYVNCSSIGSSNKTLNEFFNNPPIINTPERMISHSTIFRHANKIPVVKHPAPKIDTSPNRFVMILSGSEDNDERADGTSVDESVEIPESNDLGLTETSKEFHPDTSPEPYEESERQVQMSEEQTISRSTSNQTIKSVVGNINISATISISMSINIRHRNDSASDVSPSSSSSDEPSPPPTPKRTARTPGKTPSKPTPHKTPSKPTPHKTPSKATPQKSTPKKASAQKITPRKEKNAAAPNTAKKALAENFAAVDDNDFHTPNKKTNGELVIEEDVQEMLQNLYGDSWKTPQLLKSCKAKGFQNDLRKSLHANNFDTFIRNIPKDLESTRINSGNGEESPNNPKCKEPQNIDKDGFKTPSSNKPVRSSKPNAIKTAQVRSVETKSIPSEKKTVRSVKAQLKTNKMYDLSDTDTDPECNNTNLKNLKPVALKTPKFHEICDSDTQSDSSDVPDSDDDFNPNETWNASSSDDDCRDEKSHIKTTHTGIRKSRRDEEIIFIPEANFLEQYEYKKPAGLPPTPSDLNKKPKRKLFTHTHYEDEPQPSPDADDSKKSEDEENDTAALNIPPFRQDSSKTPSFSPTGIKSKMPAIYRTPKSALKVIDQKMQNKFGTYGFLKSLDVELNKQFCDPEAVQYRTNFKSKKLELASRLFKLYNDKVFDGQLTDVPVKWNKKLTNTAGRCNNSRRCNVRKSELELSEKVVTSADRLRCTLIHEMCHAATWILNGENGHGQTWKRWAAKSNAIFPELPKIGVCHDYAIEYKYAYQCVNCKAKSNAHSKSRKVDQIRCSICHGAIEVFLNKKNKDGQIIMTPVSKEVKGFPKFVQMKYKEIRTQLNTHKDVMQILSKQFASLNVEQRAQY